MLFEPAGIRCILFTTPTSRDVRRWVTPLLIIVGYFQRRPVAKPIVSSNFKVILSVARLDRKRSVFSQAKR